MVYGGVRLHVEGWSDFDHWSTWRIIEYWLIAVIDIPLSFVADTLTLPITVPIELSR